MKLRVKSRDQLHEVQGETTGIESTQIRWFLDCQVGRLDHVSSDQRQLKGGHQAQIHSDKMVLMTWPRQGGWTGWPVAKDTQN